jgi:hypothetical protein
MLTASSLNGLTLSGTGSLRTSAPTGTTVEAAPENVS